MKGKEGREISHREEDNVWEGEGRRKIKSKRKQKVKGEGENTKKDTPSGVS